MATSAAPADRCASLAWCEVPPACLTKRKVPLAEQRAPRWQCRRSASAASRLWDRCGLRLTRIGRRLGLALDPFFLRRQNLALNIAEKGFSISVFNRSSSKTDDAVRRAAKEGAPQAGAAARNQLVCNDSSFARNPGRPFEQAFWLQGYEGLRYVAAEAAVRRLCYMPLVGALEKFFVLPESPESAAYSAVIILVKAGAPVDDTIAGLLVRADKPSHLVLLDEVVYSCTFSSTVAHACRVQEHMEPGDIIVDGGNEWRAPPPARGRRFAPKTLAVEGAPRARAVRAQTRLLAARCPRPIGPRCAAQVREHGAPRQGGCCQGGALHGDGCLRRRGGRSQRRALASAALLPLDVRARPGGR